MFLRKSSKLWKIYKLCHAFSLSGCSTSQKPSLVWRPVQQPHHLPDCHPLPGLLQFMPQPHLVCLSVPELPVSFQSHLKWERETSSVPKDPEQEWLCWAQWCESQLFIYFISKRILIDLCVKFKATKNGSFRRLRHLDDCQSRDAPLGRGMEIKTEVQQETILKDENSPEKTFV